ncbi:unnamed protein product, partial [Prorocentrum cordatum]
GQARERGGGSRVRAQGGRRRRELQRREGTGLGLPCQRGEKWGKREREKAKVSGEEPRQAVHTPICCEPVEQPRSGAHASVRRQSAVDR